VALDCAATVGYATDAYGAAVSGCQRFELRRGESDGIRLIRFGQWLNELFDTTRPRLVVFEAPFVYGKRPSSAQIAYRFTGKVEETCAARGIEYTSLPPAALKWHATRKGTANKDVMKAAAQAKWPHYDPEVDAGGDESDALWLLDWVQSGMPERARPEKKRRTPPDPHHTAPGVGAGR